VFVPTRIIAALNINNKKNPIKKQQNLRIKKIIKWHRMLLMNIWISKTKSLI
jgi:hypothetical protein